MKLELEASRLLLEGYLELFVLAGALMSDGGVVPGKAESLHEQVQGTLQACRRKMLEAGLSETIISDSQLPVIALLDEAAARNAAFREQWHSLQHSIYGHMRLGHQVFERLGELRLEPATPVELLELYERCLLWGFQGEYGPDRLPELATLREALHNDIVRKRDAGSPLIPELEDVSRSRAATSILSPWWVAVFLAALLFVVWGAFRLALTSPVNEAEKQVSAAEAALKAAAGTEAGRNR